MEIITQVHQDLCTKMFTVASFVIKFKKKTVSKSWLSPYERIQLLNWGSCALRTVRPNNTDMSGVWAEKGLLQGHTRRQEAHARQTLNSLKDFRKAFLKARWQRGAVGCRKLLDAAIFHPRRLGQDVPVNLQQNKCHSLFYNFLSLYE